ncbi:MAG: GNAT family N-acetyltransferase [Bacteroidaceae bacterium]|nr:GNAT family N-acetyltransferase [Bacteroidaceae bacterium]
MTNVTVSQVTTRKELRAFVRFNYKLYKDCPQAVPDLLEDTLDTLDARSNPAFRFCDAAFFLARIDGEIVGRVAAIINHRANKRWNKNEVRFGWIDFIDDLNVSRALLDTVEQWGREHGMDSIVGPLGFTDLDPEGMLTEGFDQLSTLCTIYNYPYYPQHMTQLGYVRETGWVERKVFVPKGEHEANNAKYFRIAEVAEERYGFRQRHFRSKREIKKGGYVEKMLGVINRAYVDLYGYSELDEAQMKWYADRFLLLLDRRFLSVVENQEGEIIGVGVCMPSLSRAVQKAKAKLFPFGWLHIAYELWFRRKHQILDMLLIGVLPEYHDKGANALFFADIIPCGIRCGYEWAESHPQLEDNIASQKQWKNLDCSIHKRRAVFSKSIR